MIQILEDILPLPIAVSASNAIPDKDWPWWHRYNNKDCIKYGSVDHLRFPNPCKVAIELLTIESSKRLNLKENVFPDLDFYAGGMHMLPPNGWLGGHYDAEYHPLYNWKRVGSLVWFANTAWKEEWGGQLIIGDTKVLPKFNMAAYFDTDKCWHEVLKNTGPEYRKTFAIFFWEKVDEVPVNIFKNSKFEK